MVLLAVLMLMDTPKGTQQQYGDLPRLAKKSAVEVEINTQTCWPQRRSLTAVLLFLGPAIRQVNKCNDRSSLSTDETKRTSQCLFNVKKISKPVPADGAIPLVLAPWFE